MQLSDLIRLNMSYLSDSHGYLIETHKKVPIIIIEIPIVAHIRVCEGVSTCDYRGNGP